MSRLRDPDGTKDLTGEKLDRLATPRGHSAVLRCDNRPGRACAAMAGWPGERIGLHFTPPGPTWCKGYIES